MVLAFGATLGLMNWAIYQSFARIPLGHRGHHRVHRAADPGRASARGGPATWFGWCSPGSASRCSAWSLATSTSPASLFALLAGAAWAAYILLSAQTGRRWQGLDGLAMASVVATVLLTPVVAGAGGDAPRRTVVLLGAAVGLLSSVIPYSCEMAALRTLPPAVFSILMSLEPAAAALAGLVVVSEFLSPVQMGRHRLRRHRQHRCHPERATIAEPVPD